jgi:hypothetical protein
VQLNESYNAHSPDIDGGAYDIDWATNRNLYQYNYGHDCDGYCISIFGAGGGTTTDAVIRYNVCANNGRRGDLALRQGDVFLATWDAGSLDGIKIYNNTSYWNPARNAPYLVNHAVVTGERPRYFMNNIVISSVPWLLDTESTLEMDYNLYWYQGDKNPVWLYGKNGIYTRFADFQNSGQEAHGLFADPLVKDFANSAVGRPSAAYSLLAGSPAIDAGADLGEMGGRDFFGAAIPFGAGYDIGAAEWQGKPRGSIAPVGPLTFRAFLDPRSVSGQAQVVFLRSIAQQFATRIEVVVPMGAFSAVELANLALDWGLPVQAEAFQATLAPSTLLLDNLGQVVARWDGLALPYSLALAVQWVR